MEGFVMKKIFCLFASMLIFFSVSALAEDVDYSSMSTDELIEIQRMVETELEERLGTGEYVEIPAGYHVVGEDIGAGIYELKVNGSELWWVYIFENEMSKDEYVKANSEYETALKEWDTLHDAGEAELDTHPDLPDLENYATSSVYISGACTQKLEIQEGQILLVKSYVPDAPLLIRPWTGGLFMD